MGDKEYYQRNKERIKQKAKANYYKNREKKIQYAVKYQKANKDRKRIWNNHYRQKIRNELLILLGSVCVVCGTTEAIELDHKNAGGCADRVIRGDNHTMYRYYLGHPDEAKEKLQLLCKTHNLVKEHLNKERWH